MPNILVIADKRFFWLAMDVLNKVASLFMELVSFPS